MSLYNYKSTVKEVIDGDTLIADIDLGFDITKETKIRLAYIDTPELTISSQREKAIEAKEFLQSKILDNNHECYINSIGQGTHGRYLGEIFLNHDMSENSLNKQLVANGHIKEGYIPDSEALPNNFIDINQASELRFQWLPGIGPSTASNIIDYRNTNGSFEKIVELDDVYGIGESTLNELSQYVVV